MALRLVDSNVVVIARQFNPSIFSQLWLVRNGIVGEDEFQPGTILTDVLVQAVTSQFTLAVVPQRLQFGPNESVHEQQELVVEKVGTIVRQLPHTPFTAFGLNLTWHLIPQNVDAGILSRRIFFKEGHPLYAAFSDGDPRYGAYFSKNALGCRLKLDVKPVNVESLEGIELQLIQFAFNLHLDLTDDVQAVERIVEMLGRWNEAKAVSEAIVRIAEESDQP